MSEPFGYFTLASFLISGAWRDVTFPPIALSSSLSIDATFCPSFVRHSSALPKLLS
ncbi:MAG: hypothetical protein IJ856_04120 [Candidatus Methanomethylophilaceae archaeon]|nr:hypothetical protein [Candidatus Methanomethylophilaceae archaeon]